MRNMKKVRNQKIVNNSSKHHNQKLNRQRRLKKRKFILHVSLDEQTVVEHKKKFRQNATTLQNKVHCHQLKSQVPVLVVVWKILTNFIKFQHRHPKNLAKVMQVKEKKGNNKKKNPKLNQVMMVFWICPRIKWLSLPWYFFNTYFLECLPTK